MQNNPETNYFVYFYVFTCEKCNHPHLETRVAAEAPSFDDDRTPAEWYCKNCDSPQSTAGYRSAGYTTKLLVKSGKCSERG